MKKFITLSAIFALSVATVAEAKGGRSAGRSFSVTGKPIATQKTQNINTNTQKDATFDNTRTTNTAQAQTTGSNRLASFATGAAAGYVLSSVLTPNTAQANQTTQAATENSSIQAVNNPQNVANTVANVAQFKSIGGQIDPYLVEKTDGYRRYCISGVQYLASAMPSQGSPIVMVNPNGTPLACQLIP